MTTNSDELTREYFDSMLISTRYLDSDLPTLDTQILGKTFKTPVMTAALSHLHNICDNAMCEYALGAKQAGVLGFVGMTEDDELIKMLDTGADLVKIIKPHKDDEIIYKKLELAAQHGAFAVGMDIDHAISSDGRYDCVFGLEMVPKSSKLLQDYINATNLPFIVKGVLSASDAYKSVDSGAKAIIVSHHHGIMNCMVPPLLVLPEIIDAVNGQAQVYVDCGIVSGMDVFKCLALGANAVCIGRALMEPLKHGATGVASRIDGINRELMTVMARTGAHDVKSIDPSVIKYLRR